ncbi:MAG: AAA family ATPase [Burkholderiales bacterium]|nr:AAA family ATPase [Burkholderiales bacterium]
MRFEQILDAATDLLQRRQRVSDRALQREYGLDAEALADLIHELVKVQRVARLDDEGVLCWTPPAAASPAPAPFPGATPAPLPPLAALAAERRLITVLFCDVAGSTRLAGRLDPEDWRDLLRTYQHACANVLQPLGGHIAQYLGDGILAYFGWPQGHEDDAERAVRAALALQPAVQRATGALAGAALPGGLRIRVGIHTGVVVVGEMGAADRREALALGEAPNLAAHIQQRAAPGTVMVSDTTLRLLHDGFITEDLGLHHLKDASQPMRLAWVQGERDPAERLLDGRPPLIDLDGQLALLHQAWAAARNGTGRVVTLRGGPGLGKTRLASELRSALQAGGAESVVLRCSPFHRHSALYPLAQHLARRSNLSPQSADEEVQERLGAMLDEAGVQHPDALALLAALVVPGSAPAQAAAALSPAEVMQGTQQVLLDWLTGASVRAPMLLLCEDLHWADPSTLKLLDRIVARAPRVQGLLVLLTQRPDFEPPWPVESDTQLIELQRLPPDAMRLLVRGLAHDGPAATGALPDALVERIVDTADGVPLYAEEILRAVLDDPEGAATVLASAEPGNDLAHWPTQVPTTLNASLMSRLERLGSAKPLAQTAALLGREFTFELLAAVSEQPAPELSQGLHLLVSAGLLRRRGIAPQARYVFRHALLQAAAEESLLRSARKALHQRIASVLATQFPGVLELEPETVARHFTEGGEPLRALPLWRRAGERALARSAVIEALADLDQGMALLDALPPGEHRDRHELGLQVLRLAALRASQGVAATATGETSERAVALARALYDEGAMITALNGLYAYHMVRGQCAAALAPARQLLSVALTNADPTIEMISHRALGAVAFHVGDPVTARAHLQRALAMYDHERHAALAHAQGIDHKVMTGNFLALTLFVLGEAEEAQALRRELVQHGEATGHAHSLAQALVFGCVLLSLAEDGPALATLAERTAQIGREHGFVLMASGGRFFQGAALLHQGRPEAGLPLMSEGAAAWWGTGARNYRAYVEMLMAQAEAALGRLDNARTLLLAAHEGIAMTGETWVEPELRRVEALLLRDVEGAAACERRLREALACAERQRATGWQRKCLASLAAQGVVVPVVAIDTSPATVRLVPELAMDGTLAAAAPELASTSTPSRHQR